MQLNHAGEHGRMTHLIGICTVGELTGGGQRMTFKVTLRLCSKWTQVADGKGLGKVWLVWRRSGHSRVKAGCKPADAHGGEGVCPVATSH